MGSLTVRDIRRAARRTVETLEGGDYRCCVFGSLACSVWGMDRIPDDVDIVVFGQHDPEDIKTYIVDNHNRFSLEKSGRPGATHKILYFNFHRGLGLRCKVDILVSGRYSPLHIPIIPQRYIAYPNGHDIPVVPFLVLIILKVQGWRDHCKSSRSDFQDKIPQDIEDIDTLLDVTDEDDHKDSNDWLPQWFFKRAERLVIRYTDKFPGSAYSFRELGFDV